MRADVEVRRHARLALRAAAKLQRRRVGVLLRARVLVSGLGGSWVRLWMRGEVVAGGGVSRGRAQARGGRTPRVQHGVVGYLVALQRRDVDVGVADGADPLRAGD